jgi:hypothetical protein
MHPKAQTKAPSNESALTTIPKTFAVAITFAVVFAFAFAVAVSVAVAAVAVVLAFAFAFAVAVAVAPGSPHQPKRQPATNHTYHTFHHNLTIKTPHLQPISLKNRSKKATKKITHE